MIPDDPISSKENDLLHRYPLAARIAGMLNNFKADQSIVIGIEGDWGSGKTSFINLILEELSQNTNQVIRFNPWNFSDQNELIKDFFNSIINSIKSSDDQHGEKKAKEIRHYSEKLLKHSDFHFAPEISFLKVFKFKLGEWSKRRSDEPLEKQKASVNALLKKLEKRIVIVIDDIDRLDSNETKLIFKLVKITGNFSNTIFILAYDRRRVCERIKENGVEGEEYLKKIIQVSFGLPIPDSKDLVKILTTDLDKTIQGIDEKYWDDVRWGNLFHGGFKEIFPNVRDIKRFISGLGLDLEIVGKDEINPIDFIGIEAIHVVAPETYIIIRNEKAAFINTGKYYFGHDEAKEKEERKKICEEAVVKSPEPIREHIRGIIRQLFPQVDGIYTNTSYGGDWLQIWRKQLSMH